MAVGFVDRGSWGGGGKIWRRGGPSGGGGSGGGVGGGGVGGGVGSGGVTAAVVVSTAAAVVSTAAAEDQCRPLVSLLLWLGGVDGSL